MRAKRAIRKIMNKLIKLYIKVEIQDHHLFLFIFDFVFEMGVYLSEPETSKNIQKGSKNQMAFVSCEMQGTHFHYFRLEKKYGGCCYPRS